MADDGRPGGGGPDEPEADGVDPFEGLTLDDDFVAGASVREESAEERLARLARIDAEHRRLAAEREVQRASLDRSLRRKARRQSRSGGGHRQRLVVIGLMAVVFAGLVVWNVRKGPETASIGLFGDATGGTVGSGARPPAGVDSQTQPINTVSAPVTKSDSFVYMQTQPGGDDPVAYDPCRVIHVVINDRTAIPVGTALVNQAIASVSAATGLEFVVDGLTDEAPSTKRAAYQPDRYGERWAPVLIAWSDPEEVPGLAGDVAGLGGSSSLVTGSEAVYVTGGIDLDGPDLAMVVSRPDGEAEVRAIIEHELGHLVGLDHVNDPAQLMDAENIGQLTYASGDLNGLWNLGRGQCFPKV